MRSLLLFVLAGAAGVAGGFVVAAPASAATRDWPLRDFERVQLSAVADVTITAGPRFAIHAEGEQALVDNLDATVRDATLYLGWVRKPPSVRKGRLAVAITMPRVAGAGLKGVGTIAVDRADAPQVVLALEGVGSIKVAAVQAEQTVIALHGTGSIDAAGSTGRLDARRSGVGSIDASGLVARSAVLSSTGIGRLAAQVDGPVTVTQSGIGSVSVTGHPVCTTHHSGIGSVHCGG